MFKKAPTRTFCISELTTAFRKSIVIGLFLHPDLELEQLYMSTLPKVAFNRPHSILNKNKNIDYLTPKYNFLGVTEIQLKWRLNQYCVRAIAYSFFLPNSPKTRDLEAVSFILNTLDRILLIYVFLSLSQRFLGVWNCSNQSQSNADYLLLFERLINWTKFFVAWRQQIKRLSQLNCFLDVMSKNLPSFLSQFFRQKLMLVWQSTETKLTLKLYKLHHVIVFHFQLPLAAVSKRGWLLMATTIFSAFHISSGPMSKEFWNSTRNVPLWLKLASVPEPLI